MRILVAEDSRPNQIIITTVLRKRGHHVELATNGEEALQIVDSQKPDLLIVDWMMPKMDGVSLIRQLREDENKTMVLMLTARDAIENRVDGLESGADDYLVKPFAPAELVARVHALLRRIEPKPESQMVTYLDVSLDPGSREARRGEVSLALTLTEFNLLHLLLRHPRQVLERAQILSDVWGYDFGGDDNVLEIYIGYLRKKLEQNGGSRLIHTVRGVGYVLREE